MIVDVYLSVTLKGTDLVASTAYLTLVDKMGFQDNLLGMKRLEEYRFAIETADGPATVSTLRRALSVQSTFYNRNKHNYFLECRWDGERVTEGISAEEIHGLLEGEVTRGQELDVSQDLDSQQKGDRVILRNVPVYRVEVIVEDREDFAKTVLARKLEAELSTAPVRVSALGTCWHLAIRAGSEDEAKHLTETIVVTERRDHGLLLNPNEQRYTIQLLQLMDLSRE